MTFQQLQYLLEVSRTGSVTQAAKNLFVSYSSISISISNLEKELGYPLFTREKTGLFPTELGEQVLEHATQICCAYEQINQLGQQRKRFVRINCLDNPIYSAAFTRLLEECRNTEDVNISMSSYSTNVLYHKLVMGELDLSILTVLNFSIGHWESKLQKGGLQRELLRILPAAVKVGKGHPLYDAKLLYPYDLQNRPMVDNPDRPLTASLLFKGFCYTDASKVLMISADSTRQQVIARGLAYALTIMPPEGQRQDDDFRYIPLEGVHYYIQAAWNPQHPVQPETQRFLQLLREELQKHYPLG